MKMFGYPAARIFKLSRYPLINSKSLFLFFFFLALNNLGFLLLNRFDIVYRLCDLVFCLNKRLGSFYSFKFFWLYYIFLNRLIFFIPIWDIIQLEFMPYYFRLFLSYIRVIRAGVIAPQIYMWCRVFIRINCR